MRHTVHTDPSRTQIARKRNHRRETNQHEPDHGDDPMHARYQRWDRPPKDPQPDCQRQTGDGEGGDFRLGCDGSVLLLVLLGDIVVVEAREDVQNQTYENRDEC